MMAGREDKSANNLFYLCSLIEYIGRKTKNHRNVIVNAIGKDGLQHILHLAAIYHNENIDKLTFELIGNTILKMGFSTTLEMQNTQFQLIEILAKYING